MTKPSRAVTRVLAVFAVMSPGFFAPAAPSPTTHIYRISAGECTSRSDAIAQTGFRVNGLSGIVTALHGVVGCRSVTASSGDDVLNDLEIVKADIARDIALLWSPRLAERSPVGLVAAPRGDVTGQDGLQVIGYPKGVFKPRPTTKIDILDRAQLADLLPPGQDFNALTKRASPAIDIDVLSIQAPLVPGHSGAPLLNREGRVLGVVNGGLDLGRIDMAWAIPWQDIQWQVVSRKVPGRVSAADVKRLNELAKLDIRLVFGAENKEKEEKAGIDSSVPSLPVNPPPSPSKIEPITPEQLVATAQMNTNAGNEGSLSVITWPETGQPAVQFVYNIKNSPPDQDYIGFDVEFAPQDWSRYKQVCLTIESNEADRILFFQYGRFQNKASQTITGGTKDYCFSIMNKNDVSVASVGYLGVYVENSRPASGSIIIGSIYLVS